MSNISLEEKIKELINALKLERKSLSSFKRTKISAADKRVSSAAIGSVLGIGVLSAITLIIVLPDVPILGFHFFRFHHTTLSGKSNTAV
ncbi:hypothetical protein FSP39_022690 [Pinctada imbricata]|uniref:Uncharacterized protein n=1 Tax=Pinctada imbricata TaxID=66713 RepID=A0AA89CA97_PINIB|nr:hypothetical protein FSP39_022690 [Pinctada imbricata]